MTIHTATQPLPIWWSVDGKYLAWRDQGDMVLWPVYAGQEKVILEDLGGPAVPSPDCGQVAYYRGRELWVWNWQEHQKFKLTTLKGGGDELPEPRWSPDGRSLLLAWQHSLFIVRW